MRKELLTKKSHRIARVEYDGFIVEFYANKKATTNNYAKITTRSNNFELKVHGFSYGYLLSCYKADNKDEILAYCTMVYMIVDGVYKDSDFANDLITAEVNYYKRLEEKAKSAADAITSEQVEMDAAAMNDIIEEKNMHDNELREKRNEEREIIKELLNENAVTEKSV